jgi:hypothetical protein
MKSNRHPQKKKESLVSVSVDNDKSLEQSSSGALPDAVLPTVCGVCQSLSPKYKCPKCLVPYCSIACCKTHKEAHHSAAATAVLPVEAKEEEEAVTAGLVQLVKGEKPELKKGKRKVEQKKINDDAEEPEDLSAFENIMLLTDQQKHKLSHSSELLTLLKSNRFQSHLSAINDGKTVRERLISLRLMRENNKEFNEAINLLLKSIE